LNDKKNNGGDVFFLYLILLSIKSSKVKTKKPKETKVEEWVPINQLVRAFIIGTQDINKKRERGKQ
jgi:hypothetical protein